MPNKSLIRRGDPETISALTDPELHDLLILAKMKRWHTGVTQIEIEKKKRGIKDDPTLSTSDYGGPS